MKKIVYAGTFDPLTNGHWWVIKSALDFADKVLVFVAENPAKKTMFTALERKSHVEQVIAENNLEDKIEVHIIRNEYVATRAIKMGAEYMIRGIRNQIDFDYEALLQKTNTDVLGGAKTIFVMPPRDLDSVSSSFVKSLMGPVGWHFKIKQFLPPAVYKKLLENFIRKTANTYIVDERNLSVKNFIESVITAYGAEDRHYHNLEHLAHCLQELNWFAANKENVSPVMLFDLCVALMSHDYVYGQQSEKSDEQLSADFVKENFASKGHRAYSLVLATEHGNPCADTKEDSVVMRCIDLAILGQDWSVYEQYTKNVRQEYLKYNDEAYAKGRKQVLESLLKKMKNGEIFNHPMFNSYIEQAMENVQKEISILNER